MQLAHQVIVVTGGGHGIGRAMCRRFAAERPRGIVVADLDLAAARQVADEIGGAAIEVDVANESAVESLAAQSVATYGPIDLFCSNAGVLGPPEGLEASNREWQRVLEINFWAHLYAARAVVPSMLERGRGYLLQTASAAGLLSQIGAAPYAVSKHAAVALAEWLSITYGDQGLKVSCLCPQGVRTRMLDEGKAGSDRNLGHFLAEGALEPDAVADMVVEGLAAERFLILPHAEVGDYVRRKGDDYDRWIRGMRRLQRSVSELPPTVE